MPEEVNRPRILKPIALRGLDDYVVALKWSPHGDVIAAGLGSGQFTLFDSSDLNPIKRWNAHSHALTALAWSPKENRIATGGQDSGAVDRWGKI